MKKADKISLMAILMALSSWDHSEGVEMSVRLSPMGNFVIKAPRLEGYTIKKGETLIAEKIRLDLPDVSTGIELRDQHVREHFQTQKDPYAYILKAVGRGSRFAAELKVNGVVQKVTGRLKEDSQKIEVQFSVKNSDFKLPSASYMGVGVMDEIQVKAVIPIAR